MKKGQIVTGIVEEVKFPNKGIVKVLDEETDRRLIVKNVIKGQKISVRINKLRNGQAEGQLLEVLTAAPNQIEPACKHFGVCGGCTYQHLSYEDQLKLKEEQVRKLLAPYIGEGQFEGIRSADKHSEYRNKMEFSFGDGYMGGPLELGMHKRGSFYDIVSVTDCQIVDADYRAILSATLSYFREKETPFYHKMKKEGYLRHFIVRKAAYTGEILVDLVTTSRKPKDTICMEKGLLEDWMQELLSLKLNGKIVGILHTINDNLADAVVNEGTEVLYGQDYFYEELLGLRFKITPFSFFQTNSYSAKVLYETAREYVVTSGGEHQKTVFDLYSGTGTITQLLAGAADRVIGVEIIEEAVEAARENAKLNGIENCDFIAGDVLKVIAELEEKPDYIVLDPPRDGVHPKALKRIIDYGVEHIVYISCKPTSLVRDLEMLTACGYKVERAVAVDQFPTTANVETVVLLSQLRQKPDD